MRFDFKRRIVGGAAADPNPRTNPGDVLDAMMFVIPPSLRNADSPARSILLALEGTAAQSLAFEVYALDETGDPGASLSTQPEPVASTARRFYQATTEPLALGVGNLREYVLNRPSSGKVYVRVTTAPAADAVLMVACD